MSFFMEYLQKKIIENMEDPKERERRWEKRLRAAKASAEEAKSRMNLPTKPWGFWRSEKQNAKNETNLDPVVSKMPGRAKPAL